MVVGQIIISEWLTAICLLLAFGGAAADAGDLNLQRDLSESGAVIVPTSVNWNDDVQIRSIGSDIPIAKAVGVVCSGYDSSICHDLSPMFKAKRPSFGATFAYLESHDTLINFGFDTGYEAEKIRVAPALLLGGAKRFWISESHGRSLVVSGNYRFGATIEYKPCYDSFDRAYSCLDLTAWSDFKYNPSGKLFNLAISYQW